eukprot:2395875-Pyramimonas_sp.AAC.1
MGRSTKLPSCNSGPFCLLPSTPPKEVANVPEEHHEDHRGSSYEDEGELGFLRSKRFSEVPGGKKQSKHQCVPPILFPSIKYIVVTPRPTWGIRVLLLSPSLGVVFAASLPYDRSLSLTVAYCLDFQHHNKNRCSHDNVHTCSVFAQSMFRKCPTVHRYQYSRMEQMKGQPSRKEEHF